MCFCSLIFKFFFWKVRLKLSIHFARGKNDAMSKFVKQHCNIFLELHKLGETDNGRVETQKQGIGGGGGREGTNVE